MKILPKWVWFVFLAGSALAVPGNANAMVWTVNKTQSSISFTGMQTGQSFTGSFDDFSVNVSFDPESPATGHAFVDIKTCSAHTGDTQRDEAMPDSDWFSCAVFPDAKFSTTSFKALGSGRFMAIGHLTIRGITHVVMLPFTFAMSGNSATVTGSLILTRTDYGVGQGAWADGQWVSLPVTITIRLVAIRS